MKTLQITIIVILTISTILTTCVFAQNTGSVALVFLRPDKEIYFPGDSVFIHGQDDMNVTSITIGLEKNHKLMTMSEESQVLQNGTFYANFTLPKDPDAQYWSLVSGPLVQDLNFKPVYLSPLKQFKSGIAARDVKCNDDLQLIFKTEGDIPACVKTPVLFHLSELGWGYIASSFVIKTDLLNSTISGGKIQEIQYHLESRSIIIKIQTMRDGSLMVTIPKFITDLYPSDKPFKDFHTVLADGMEEKIDLVPTATGSSFTIPFTNGTQEIEITGNQVGQQS